LPVSIVNPYLLTIPFVEIGLGLDSISNRHKAVVIYAWLAFMLSLLIGHYILRRMVVGKPNDSAHFSWPNRSGIASA